MVHVYKFDYIACVIRSTPVGCLAYIKRAGYNLASKNSFLSFYVEKENSMK